jgi:hypothetical protein
MIDIDDTNQWDLDLAQPVKLDLQPAGQSCHVMSVKMSLTNYPASGGIRTT